MDNRAPGAIVVARLKKFQAEWAITRAVSLVSTPNGSALTKRYRLNEGIAIWANIFEPKTLEIAREL